LNIENKIVCIESADPGYDFIFNHKINGLITAFGGPNSHMSIRCNEFNIPAAIGIGEKKFHQLIKNNTLYLNCEKQMLSGV
jgi:phosphoenolpyruvate-protein kinase (PTS system EI component)